MARADVESAVPVTSIFSECKSVASSPNPVVPAGAGDCRAKPSAAPVNCEATDAMNVFQGSDCVRRNDS